MKKIWLVTSGDYSDNHILSVWSSLEGAKGAVVALGEDGEGDYFGDGWTFPLMIEGPFEVDPDGLPTGDSQYDDCVRFETQLDIEEKAGK